MNNTHISNDYNQNTANRNTIDFLKIASINVNSIVTLNKRYDLHTFVETHNFDIILICETKLNNRHKIQFSEYNLIRTDRAANSKGGGTAILIKNNIPYEIIYSPSSKSNEIIEYTIALIKLETKELYLIALYSNNLEKKKFIIELEYLFAKLKLNDADNLYIIAGDFNARHTAWGDSVNKRKGILLKNWLENDGILYRSRLIPPLSSTFPSANSFLDLCLLDSRLVIRDLINNKIQTLNYNSDHCAFSFTVSVSNIAHLNKTDPFNNHRFTFKKTKWKKFSNKLALNHTEDISSNRNLSIDEIDFYITKIQESIQKTIMETVPKYKPTDNILNYVNTKIKKLHKYKSFLISTLNRQYKKAYPISSFSIPFLKSIINKISTILKNEYQSSYTKYWNSQISNIVITY